MFAKKYKGKFILRIEDTDRDRYQKDSVQNLIESLNWCGIHADYGPHLTRDDDNEQGAPWLQSQRLNIYQNYADLLLKSNKAYRCFCDETRLVLIKKNAAKRLGR